MKTLRVLLRRTLAIALLSLPAEALLDEDKRIALAFDDTALPGATEALLDELDRLQIKATLFPPDSELVKVPEQTRGVIDADHALRDCHDELVEVATEDAGHKIAGAVKILRELSCDQPLMFPRPFDPPPLESALNGEASPLARWELMPEAETEREDTEALVDYLAENAFPGAVVLLHAIPNQREQLLRSLPLIGERLRAKGYRFATLSELLRGNGA